MIGVRTRKFSPHLIEKYQVKRVRAESTNGLVRQWTGVCSQERNNDILPQCDRSER